MSTLLRNDQLRSVMCVSYIDSTYIAVKRENVSKEAIYLAMRFREDGSKEVLTYAIAPT